MNATEEVFELFDIYGTGFCDTFVAQVLCGVQTLLVFLGGRWVYYPGLGLNANRDKTRLGKEELERFIHARSMSLSSQIKS